MVAVRTLVLPAPAEPVVVHLELGDALQVGLTMIGQARSGRGPSTAVDTYERVGRQLVAAARAGMGTVGQ